jgi:hypothetical protein
MYLLIGFRRKRVFISILREKFSFAQISMKITYISDIMTKIYEKTGSSIVSAIFSQKYAHARVITFAEGLMKSMFKENSTRFCTFLEQFAKNEDSFLR